MNGHALIKIIKPVSYTHLKPYSVLLFDEIEKAHPDVFNILLQVLDDGRITDSQGRTVDFKNTIIILTSNLGSSALLDGIEPDGAISAAAKAEVNDLLRRSFRPEFLNRLDEIVFYKPLTKDDIRKIVDLQIKDLNRRLSDRQISCEVTDAAKDFIVENGYDPVYGARQMCIRDRFSAVAHPLRPANGSASSAPPSIPDEDIVIPLYVFFVSFHRVI